MNEQETKQIIFEFRESNLKKKEVTIFGKRIIEEFYSEREFKKIEPKLPLHDNLDSDKILLFVDSTRDKVWMWCGGNTTSRMKSVARELVPKIRDKYGINFKIMAVDENNEPIRFQEMLGLEVVSNQRDQQFKVNEFLTVKLEDDKTFIYIKGKKFIQCIRLLLQIPPQDTNLYEEVESIDEAAEIYKHSLYLNKIVEGPMAKPSRFQNRTITPEQEFWGHCSNIQVWAEHDYDTRILHSNLAFQLLKKLTQVGDPKAKAIFKEEIAIRYESRYFSVVAYLIEQGYLLFLDKDHLRTLLDNNLILEDHFIGNKDLLTGYGALLIKIF